MKHLYTFALVVFFLCTIHIFQLEYVLPLLTLPEIKSNTPTHIKQNRSGYNNNQINRMIIKENMKKRIQKNYKGIVS